MSYLFDEYTQGVTAPIDYYLKHRNPETGAISTFDATGMTIEVVLKDSDDNVISHSGTAEWADATVSKARFNPAATDFLVANSPCTLHWKVTDTEGKIAFYPQGTPIEIKIYKQ